MQGRLLHKTIIYALGLGALIALFSIWYRGSNTLFALADTGGVWIALARLAGLIAEYCILAQIVLIGRIPFVERTFGHDKLNRIHHIVGLSVLIFMIAHPLMMTIGYAQANGTDLFTTYISFITS